MADLVDVNAEPENLYQAGQIIGVLKAQLGACNKLLKKVGICGYLRSKLETYEILLSDFSSRTRLRDYNSDPPNLDTLRINLQDETMRKSYGWTYLSTQQTHECVISED